MIWCYNPPSLTLYPHSSLIHTRLVVEVEDAVVRLQKVWVWRREVSTNGQSWWDLFGLLHPHDAVVLRLAHANVTMETRGWARERWDSSSVNSRQGAILVLAGVGSCGHLWLCNPSTIYCKKYTHILHLMLADWCYDRFTFGSVNRNMNLRSGAKSLE